MSSQIWLESLREVPVVAVLRATHARQYPPVIEALVRGGIRTIELTLSTEGVFEALPALIERFSDRAAIGVGTLETVEDADRALELGAAFLVTPGTDAEITQRAVQAGVPMFPGGLTPTELHSSWRAGATAVKLFPAAAVGPAYLAQLRGPFPGMRVMPSGGVGVADAVTWLRAGAVAVSLGGPLLADAFDGGSLEQLTARARQLVADIAVAFPEGVPA